MAYFYDSNLGHHEIESEEDIDFYNESQQYRVKKTCEGCGEKVRINPDYDYCNSCADKRARGWDLEG